MSGVSPEPLAPPGMAFTSFAEKLCQTDGFLSSDLERETSPQVTDKVGPVLQSAPLPDKFENLVAAAGCIDELTGSRAE